MKKWAAIIFVTVVAVALTLGPWIVCIAKDDFTYGPGGFKTFTYGFPFRIVECAPHLPIYMPDWEIAGRFLGNFAVFLSAGLACVWLIGHLRKRTATVAPTLSHG